jgi:glutamate dehydrogenase/leucine dehydrogenase
VLEELFEAWDGEEAVVRYDRESGTWMFVCIHSTVLGPAGGGTRMRVYETPADGLADAMRLSQAMTVKMAGANLERGGGKAVLAVPELFTGDKRRRLLLRYGELVQSLGGTYRTAGDMNISPHDLDVVKERCEWVYGTTGGGGNSGRGTAIAVHAGLEASVEHVFGSSDLRGRSVLVQGAGAVGADLVALLQADGAEVLVSDVDDARARATGATVVDPADVYDVECDVYSPCAIGGTLNAGTIGRLRCRIVGGSANNQLAEPEDARRLHERGILYAPDFIINAGGVIQLIGLEDRGWSEDELRRNLCAVGDTLRENSGRGGDPAEAAERLAAERIAAAAAA